ncbi:unnamed protein product [Periconia digitata]|uniref:Uncharacterized protein n=1 Tax=Periconia digitata TaxID=1303443 RepID=A0A9W4U465_9PLEO|nr:unnamed protein product [Periconia digitata]
MALADGSLLTSTAPHHHRQQHSTLFNSFTAPKNTAVYSPSSNFKAVRFSFLFICHFGFDSIGEILNHHGCDAIFRSNPTCVAQSDRSTQKHLCFFLLFPRPVGLCHSLSSLFVCSHVLLIGNLSPPAYPLTSVSLLSLASLSCARPPMARRISA